LAKVRSKDEVYASYTTLAAQIAMATIEHRDEVRLFLQENRAPATPARASVRALVGEISTGACELSEAAQRHGVIDVADPRVSGLAVVGAIEYLGLEVLRGERDLDPATIATVLVRMVLDGVRRREA
jgi:Tetracyclin repressor-like, C-terminal domain